MDTFNPMASRRDLLIGGVGAGLTLGLALGAGPALAAAGNTNHHNFNEGATTMNMVTTKDGTQIFYKDWGPRDAQVIDRPPASGPV